MAENQRLPERLGQVEPRIAELERLLEELRRVAKRQSAPFSKNKPKEESQTSDKKGKAHGRHGHRAAPPESDRTLDAPAARVLPAQGQLDANPVEELRGPKRPDWAPKPLELAELERVVTTAATPTPGPATPTGSVPVSVAMAYSAQALRTQHSSQMALTCFADWLGTCSDRRRPPPTRLVGERAGGETFAGCASYVPLRTSPDAAKRAGTSPSSGELKTAGGAWAPSYRPTSCTTGSSPRRTSSASSGAGRR